MKPTLSNQVNSKYTSSQRSEYGRQFTEKEKEIYLSKKKVVYVYNPLKSSIEKEVEKLFLKLDKLKN